MLRAIARACGVLAILVAAHASGQARVSESTTDLGPSADCPRLLRAAVLDLDESKGQGTGRGVTALQTALVQRIAERAGVGARVSTRPYPRALAEFARGEVDLLVVAEAAGRRADPAATRVPLLRLHFVSHRRVDGQVLSAGDRLVGTINGFVFPPSLLERGERLHPVNNYRALMRMVADGRVVRVLVVRPSVDAYFADHPEQRALLGAGSEVSTESMDLHIRSGLAADCRTRLASAARLPPGEIAEAFTRALPTVDPTPFLLDP